MQIVKKCGGLSLAVKSMGAFVCFERNLSKWDIILRCRVGELDKSRSDNILPSLWLNYHHPPSRLKQRFAYCSIFPKDYEIQEEQIVLLWMAEGFLPSGQEEKRTEDVGEEYVEELFSRSLFQRSSHSESAVTMCALVHDLAMFVSGEFCLRYDDNNNIKHLTSKTRHLSHDVSVDYNSWTSLSKTEHLRTFIGSHAYSSELLFVKLLEKGKSDQVFDSLIEVEMI